MPYAIDEEAISRANSMDLAKPPVKQIPTLEFPRMVYKHPAEPTRLVREVIAGQWTERTELSEHTVKTVDSESEFKQAMKQGWSEKPYVPAWPAE